MPEGKVPKNLPIAGQDTVPEKPPPMPKAAPKSSAGEGDFQYGNFTKEDQSDEVLVPVQHGRKPRLAKKSFRRLSGARMILIIGILVGIAVGAYFVYQALDQRISDDPAESSESAVIDSDNDGLSDEEEAQYGTDPNLQDTDGDSYSDKVEIDGGFNPLGPGQAN
ncbi:hypothetical protein ACFL2B_00885 [Patescibacteria group bacterium]